MIEESLALESAYATLLSPAEAVAAMHVRAPARGNRKLRRILEKVTPTISSRPGGTSRT